MKKTDKISYRQKPVEELRKLLLEAQKKVAETKAKHLTGNIKDTSVFRKIRYEIALIATLINEKEAEIKNEK
jgi:ribosomal protein L29